MNEQQAKERIEGIFTKKFDPDTFRLFISNILNDFDQSMEREWNYGAYVYADYRDHIKGYKRLGVYTAPSGEELEILIVQTQSLAKLERARTAIRNFVVKWLQDANNKERTRDNALVAFYSKEDDGADWRFSFIKVEPEAYQDDKGKVKTRSVLSPAKRYSFLVGEHENSYTAQKQLLPLLKIDYADPTLEQIEEAFSVEKVTDEFFEQYKSLYDELKKYLDTDQSARMILEAAGVDTIRFAKNCD